MALWGLSSAELTAAGGEHVQDGPLAAFDHNTPAAATGATHLPQAEVRVQAVARGVIPDLGQEGHVQPVPALGRMEYDAQNA